jgi:cytochrome P450
VIVDTVRRLPGPEEGRLLLNRLVAEGVRYGRDFAVVRVVAPEDVTDLIAPRLAEVLRDADILVRWSDTELLALLPATDRAGAARTSERLRDAAEGMATDFRAANWVGDTAHDLLTRVGTS